MGSGFALCAPRNDRGGGASRRPWHRSLDARPRLHRLRHQREGQQRLGDRHRHVEGDKNRRRRPPAARHHHEPRRQGALHLRLGRRHHPGVRSQDHAAAAHAAVGARPRDLHDQSGRQDALRVQRGRQHGHDDRHRGQQAAGPGTGRRRAGGRGNQPRRQDPCEHVRDHQHGPRSSTRRSRRSSPTCSWIHARGSRCSHPRATGSGSAPRSAARWR